MPITYNIYNNYICVNFFFLNFEGKKGNGQCMILSLYSVSSEAQGIAGSWVLKKGEFILNEGVTEYVQIFGPFL